MESLGISAGDTSRWEREGRTDILAQVGPYSSWRNPGPCPFLVAADDGRRVCGIYETRPETCREYPLAVGHMEFVDCEMLEPGDTDEHIARFMGRAT